MNKSNFKKTLLPQCTEEEFYTMARLYKVAKYDRGSYMLTKMGVQLKKGIRKPYSHEEAGYITDFELQTCSCEAYRLRPHQGACKHLKFVNYAIQNNWMEALLKLTNEDFEYENK